MNQNKIKLLFDESFDTREQLIACLGEISEIQEVFKIAGMVDLHLKKKTENPSSVAIASESRIIPKLSSVAQNCGMSLLRTDLKMGDFSDERIDTLIQQMSTEDERVMKQPDLDLEDMRRVVCQGAGAVIDRYDLPERFLEAVEFGGLIGRPDILPWNTLKRLVPAYSLKRGRHGFGVIPSGNHFFEMQYVTEIINEEDCLRYGLAEDSITLMLHSDGGLVSDDIGNLYGSRTTATGYVKALYNLRKTLLHHTNIDGFRYWRERRRNYFSKDKYVMISPETIEGKRYLEAKRLSMNAGYASRMTTVGRLKRLIGELFKGIDPKLELLCDFSHNSIFREQVGGRDMWVHRHNACKVNPGQLVFLPGYNNTSSYVCIGDNGAADYLHTMDHGAGKTIDRFLKRNLTGPLDNGRQTRNYTNESIKPEMVPHISDEGIDYVIEVLRNHQIVRPIAKLCPFAGYRYIWKGKLSRAKEKLKIG
jgi:RNA-splicing ligase RtcB